MVVTCGVTGAQVGAQDRPAPRPQPRASTAAAPVKEPAAERAGVEVEVGAAYDSLSHGFAPWRSVYLNVTQKLAARRVVYGSFRETNRFSLPDQELLGGVYFPLSRRWTALVEAQASPSHRVLAKWSLLGQVGRDLGHGWVGQVGFRHTEYNQAGANLGIFAIERYWKSYRAAYTLYLSQLQEAGHAASHSLQINYYYRDRQAIGLGFAIGQELENLGPRGILRTETRAFTLTGRHWFTTRWALTYDLSLNRQGGLYTRKGARVGLRRQF
jgi:YaiO family outer membrane protein